MKTLLNEILAYFGLVAVPIKPSKGLLNSMAMRYNHAFGMSCELTDDEIYKERNGQGDFLGAIMARQMLTLREKEMILTDMKRLHEEVVGMGFYKERLEEEYTIL